MKEFLIKIMGDSDLFELVLILVSKAFEVSIGTLRNILVNKGFKKQGAILAFFEVTLWVFIASKVITTIGDAPINGIIYSMGYALGVFFGSILENKISLGKVLIQVNSSVEYSKLLAEVLRDNGLGVTSVDAKGKDSDRVILFVYTNRKGKDSILGIINEVDKEAMVTVNDVSTLKGGYVSSWKGLRK